jgi:hypothetical protein
MWGLSIPFWETVFRWATISAFVFGGFTATAAFISAWVGYELSDIVQKDADKRIAEAKSEAARANESSERLRNDTARLQADNLSLQTVLLPRSVGLIGFDGPPKATEWFAGFQHWAGIKVLIQVVPGDPEAQNLANEIAIVLSKFGWMPELIDEKRSGVSLHMLEGLSVFSPASYKAWDPKDKAQQVFARLGDAARSLATALTNAGLGVGSYPVSGVHGLNMVVDFPPDSEGEAHNPFHNFSPRLDGVYLQVGSRPVARTLQWIKQGRPDAAGNKPADAAPTEIHK